MASATHFLLGYDPGLLYEINGRPDDSETMYRKAVVVEMNGVFLEAIRDVHRTREDYRCVFTLALLAC